MKGWAILGTGPVAHKFAADLLRLGGQVVAVASRKRDRAEAFAQRYGGIAVGYEEAVALPAIEAVYIATPPALHETHALLAIAARKATLVEKPFAIDSASAGRIQSAALAANVFCMEAMWTRFQPLTGELKRLLDAGAIGSIRQFEGRFCIAEQPGARPALFDPADGGALLHRGIYPLSLARFFLGPIRSVQATALVSAAGTDEDCVLVLTHESGAIATIRASLRSNSTNAITLQGTTGTIRAHPPIYRPNGARLFKTSIRPRATDGTVTALSSLRDSPFAHRLIQELEPLYRRICPGGRAIRAAYQGNGYGHQIQEVTSCLQAGLIESSRMPLAESVEILALADSARRQWSRT